MKSITLTQLTFIIVAICMVSFFVDADDIQDNKIEDSEVLIVKTSSVGNSDEAKSKFKQVTSSPNKFIFAKVDENNNGKLSYQEVLSTKSQWLLSSFKAIDSDTNDFITEKEIIDFSYKSMKTKSL
jgi:hypothetical protein